MSSHTAAAQSALETIPSNTQKQMLPPTDIICSGTSTPLQKPALAANRSQSALRDHRVTPYKGNSSVEDSPAAVVPSDSMNQSKSEDESAHSQCNSMGAVTSTLEKPQEPLPCFEMNKGVPDASRDLGENSGVEIVGDSNRVKLPVLREASSLLEASRRFKRTKKIDNSGDSRSRVSLIQPTFEKSENGTGFVLNVEASLKRRIAERDATIAEQTEKISKLESQLEELRQALATQDEENQRLIELMEQQQQQVQHISNEQAEDADDENCENEDESLFAELEEKRQTITEYQDVMRNILSETARMTRREARRHAHTQEFELGHPIEIGGFFGWIEGQRKAAIDRKLEEIKQRKRDLEDEVKRQRKQRQKGQTNNNSLGMHNLEQQLEEEETAEIQKGEIAGLRQAEAMLKQDEVNLRADQTAFHKELRRLKDEDCSPLIKSQTLGFIHDDPSRGRYVLLHMLGKGGFSEVWKAFDLVHARYVALKIHRIRQEWTHRVKSNYLEHARRELEIQQRLEHTNISRLHEVFQIDDTAFVAALEFSAGEDLETRLKKMRTLPEKDARIILIQIVKALRHLAEEKVIHYDLKPANVIFHSSLQSSLEVKITDFGLSKMIRNEGNNSDSSIELTSQGTGTMWYLPPECFPQNGQRGKITAKVDIWALGVVFYQMLYGKKPYGEGISQETLWNDRELLRLLAHKGAEFNQTVNKVSPEAKEFIKKCLTINPNQRPDIYTLSNDPYLRSSAPAKKRLRPGNEVAPGSSSAIAGGASSATSIPHFRGANDDQVHAHNDNDLSQS